MYAAVQESGGWFISNAGWVQGTDGVLAIDAFVSESRTERLLARIETTIAPPTAGHLSADFLQVLVVTHEHGDHANGAFLFEDAGFQVLAAPAAGQAITEHGIQTFPGVLDPAPQWGQLRPPHSIRHLHTDESFDLGGITAEVLISPHRAHTAGDVVVREPESRTVFTGDLVFHGVTPLAIAGSITGWIDALDWLAAMDPAWIVPGHGLVTDASVLDEMRRYFDWLLSLAPQIANGADPIRLARAARTGAPFGDWDLAERDAANLLRAVADLYDVPMDFGTALRTMVRAHGGPISPPR